MLFLIALSGNAQSVLWQKRYLSGYSGDTGSPYVSTAKISANSYVSAGNIYLSAGPLPYFVFTNAQGDSTGVIIPTTFAGNPIRFGAAFFVVGNGDGTFTWMGVADTTIATRRQRRNILVRMNRQGQALWSRSFNRPEPTTGRSISSGSGDMIRTADGYIAGANTYFYTAPTGSASLQRQTVVRFNNQGQKQWETYFPGYSTQTENLTTQANGSYIAAGWELVPTPLTTSGYFSLDGRLVEFAHWGDTLRTRRFGIEGDYESIQRTVPTADKGLALLMQRQARLPSGSQLEFRLVKLDSLWHTQWQVTLPSPRGDSYEDLLVNAAGEYVLAGERIATPGTITGALFRYSATGQLLWSNDFSPTANPGTNLLRLIHEPGDPLMAWGFTMVPNRPGPGVAPATQRFFSVGLGNVPAPFVPDYCRYPPQPIVFYTQPQPDSLVLRELSIAGPRYAQNVIYRWDLGDGTIIERPTGGTLRYRYAAGRIPARGTPVRLTLTNNLGCTATGTEYPFGLPSATQRSRELAARASLWPNPSAGTATFTLPEAPAGLATVQVLNALGQVVQIHAVRPQAGVLHLELDLTALATGVYAVRVNTAAGSFVKRLVRE